MNISGITNLIWLGSLSAGSFLGWYLYDFKQNELEMRQTLGEEVFRAALEDNVTITQPENHVEFDFPVVQRLFHDMNWTGVPPKVIKPTVVTPKEVEAVTAKSVDSLLDVVFVRAALFNPDSSQALVMYTDSALRGSGDPTATLVIDDHLPKPHDGIFVKDILAEGILFGFADAEREPELVSTPSVEDRIRIVEAGANGALVPVRPSGFNVLPNSTPYRPKVSVMVRRNEWMIGSDDAKRISEDYASIIAQLSPKRHRNQTTKQYDGVEVGFVPKNSVAAAHGIAKGDIIKSMNGHPVTSVQEAIQYAKNNSEKYSVWEIVIENKGAERTVTYETPAD